MLANLLLSETLRQKKEEDIMVNDMLWKKIGTETIASIRIEEDALQNGYQLEMLKHNQIPGLLQMDTVRMNGMLTIHFMMTSKMPLAHVLARRTIDKMTFLKLLFDIISVFPIMQDYMLNENAIVLDVDNIFVEPDTLAVYMMYVPTIQGNTTERLRELIRSLLTIHVRFAETIADGFVQRLLSILMKDDFHWQTLVDFIRVERLSVQIPEFTTESQACKLLQEQQNSIHKEHTHAPQIQESMCERNNSSIDSKHLQNVLKLLFSPLFFYITVLIFILFVMAFSGMFSGNDAIQKIIGFVLIAASIGYLMRKILFKHHQKAEVNQIKNRSYDVKVPVINHAVPKKETQKKSTKDKNIPNKINIPMKSKQTYNHEQSIPKSEEWIPIKSSQADHIPIQLNQIPPQKKVKDLEHLEQTVLLSKIVTSPYALVVMDAAGLKSIVPITKSPFVIGRMAELDMVLDNPAIGKMHAEIQLDDIKNKTVRVFDLNSRNGTFINDVQIDIHEGCEMKDGDRLRFANLQYVFQMKQDSAHV